MPSDQYMAYAHKWITKDVLEAAVEKSPSISATLRALGYAGVGGGSYEQIHRLIRQWGISTVHFLGKGTNRGIGHRGGGVLVVSDILRLEPHRETPRNCASVRKAMLAYGVQHKCVICGQTPTWQGSALTLQIDHINGDRRDNRPENVRFCCPNCHSQTPNFSGRKRRNRSGPALDPITG